MNILFLLGRVVLGGFFLLNGYNHFKNVSSMAGYAGSKGVPAPKLAIVGSGVLLLVAGLGIIVGAYDAVALWAAVIFLLPTTFIMHAYWKETDPQARSMQKIQFRKNLAILGACLMLLSMATPWPLSLF